jgi:hypothetical protein
VRFGCIPAARVLEACELGFGRGDDGEDDDKSVLSVGVDDHEAAGHIAPWSTRALEPLPPPVPNLRPGVYPGPMSLFFTVPDYIVDEPPDPDEGADEDPVDATEAAVRSTIVSVHATVSSSLAAMQGPFVTEHRPLLLASPEDETLLQLWERGRMPGQPPPVEILGREEVFVDEDDAIGVVTPRLAPSTSTAPRVGRIALPGQAEPEGGRPVPVYDEVSGRSRIPTTYRIVGLGEAYTRVGAASGAPSAAGFADDNMASRGRGVPAPVMKSTARSEARLVLSGNAPEDTTFIPTEGGSDDEEGDEHVAEERPVVRKNVPPPGPPATLFVRAVAVCRDGRISPVVTLRYALLRPLQHLFRAVLPPRLARLEGRVASAAGSADLREIVQVHPHTLRRRLKAIGVQKRDRDDILAALRPIRDEFGEGLGPYLHAIAVAATEQSAATA